MALYVSNPWLLVVIVLNTGAGGTSWTGEFQTLDMCQGARDEIVADIRGQSADVRIVARCEMHEMPTSGTLEDRIRQQQNLAAWMQRTPAEIAADKRLDEERDAARRHRR